MFVVLFNLPPPWTLWKWKSFLLGTSTHSSLVVFSQHKHVIKLQISSFFSHFLAWPGMAIVSSLWFKHCSFLFHFKSPFTLQLLPVYLPVLPSALPQNFYFSVFSLRACSTLYWCQNAVYFNYRLHLLVFSGKALPKFRD